MMSSQEVFGLDRGASHRRVLRQSRVVKRGERLEFIRREITPVEVVEHKVSICCGGREFIATSEMAECFLRKARLTVESHSAELIPILHEGGLELLFIADHIPFSVGTVFEHNPYLRES